MRFKLLLVLLMAAVFASPALAQPVAVDLELSLLLDISGSISTSEYNLQKQGYVNAFNNPTIVNAIQAGSIGKIAVNMIMWSGASQQSQVVGWSLISDATSSSAFATAVAGVGRPYSGLTAPQSAMSFAAPLFGSNLYDGTRQAIDISGDGTANSGDQTGDSGRQAALAAGVDVINGIVITTSSSVLNYYTNNVIAGTNADGSAAFVRQVSTFAEFGDAIEDKLLAEIIIPEPASLVVWSFFATVGLGGVYRRRRAA